MDSSEQERMGQDSFRHQQVKYMVIPQFTPRLKAIGETLTLLAIEAVMTKVSEQQKLCVQITENNMELILRLLESSILMVLTWLEMTAGL